jgi:hypothetical protein
LEGERLATKALELLMAAVVVVQQTAPQPEFLVLLVGRVLRV